ncbi:hypothetical protein [Synechococcus sp. M16CYN]|uniref:hypothetical protein n=1 Tax=Synechococcus sp. M16CYN TaxID=3103139 RepID=UPI003341D2C0
MRLIWHRWSTIRFIKNTEKSPGLLIKVRPSLELKCKQLGTMFPPLAQADDEAQHS